MKKKLFGFTLAEILITLGIIGVVSAMTIPTLITKNQKMIIEKRITQDYSIIQQVIKMQKADGLEMTNDNLIDYNVSYLKSWYNTYFAPYLKTTQICYNSDGCWQNKGETKALSGVNAHYSQKGIGVGVNVVTARLLNGTSLCLDVWSGDWNKKDFWGVDSQYSILTIYVDANGDSLPNVIGKDIYVFVYAQETGLVPAGYSLTPAQIRSNCSKNSTGNMAGVYCLARVKLDGWKILDEVWKAGN